MIQFMRKSQTIILIWGIEMIAILTFVPYAGYIRVETFGFQRVTEVIYYDWSVYQFSKPDFPTTLINVKLILLEALAWCSLCFSIYYSFNEKRTD